MELVITTGLRPEDDKRIQDAFDAFIGQAEEWAAKAYKIKVQSEEDETGMENAKAAYTALRMLQKEVEDTHKRLKEGALKYGQALDKVKRDFNDVIEPAKVYAREQAAYAETMEKNRKAELKAKRMQILAPFNVDHTHYDLENMPEDLFELTVAGLQAKKEAADAAYKKEQEERQRAAEAEQKERERLAKETAKAAKDKEKAQAEAAAATRASARQTTLLNAGFRWNGSAFVLGDVAIDKDLLVSVTDADFNALLKKTSSGNEDIDKVKAYISMIADIPKVSDDTASAIIDVITPYVNKIVDYAAKRLPN